MIKVRVNEKSISAKIGKLNEKIESRVEDRLIDMATYIGSQTRVDTGAFAESWSVVPAGSGAGRMKTRKGKPRNQSLQLFQRKAIFNIEEMSSTILNMALR